jgi:hypothetical protein
MTALTISVKQNAAEKGDEPVDLMTRFDNIILAQRVERQFTRCKSL